MPKRRAIAPEASSKRNKILSIPEVANSPKPQAGSTSTPNSFFALDGSSTRSVALQTKLQRLRASRDDATKYELQASSDPNHIVVSSTALLGALVTLYADWEVGIVPDLEALRSIIVEGVPDEADGVEQWWHRSGEVVVDLTKSRDSKVEQDVSGKLGFEMQDVSLLRFEIEEYYRRVDEWVEEDWRAYGKEEESDEDAVNA